MSASHPLAGCPNCSHDLECVDVDTDAGPHEEPHYPRHADEYDYECTNEQCPMDDTITTVGPLTDPRPNA